MKRNKIIIIIILLLVLGLIAWGSIINIPKIKGRVVDAETGKPMKGVNVRAGWVTGYADPGGGSFRTFKVHATKTDENGEFILPKTIKIKIPVIEHYQGVNLLIYEHGYSAIYRETTGNASYLATGHYIRKIYGHFIDVKLPKLKSDKEYFKNMEEIYLWMLTVGENLQFLIDERRSFSNKYPESPLLDENQLILAEYYVRLKDYTSALKEYEKLIKEYPKSKFIPLVKKDIEDLKQKNLNHK
ncbi:MAG: hypothetical protein HY755_12725 [Nitrospirae bacterium]|nr:hypothetical protein [Nitrospirota bacterium]